ncbi:putative helicase [Tokyovirus A1]|uniref:putative helicase n=1 Tax=Tokyovirus A1 TaxID=1826170 RepID=UPI0007A96DF7|nr:putative helicase [Tokyovirus A1]BAU80344.1 putative helicase [Tokyovirus A1]
MERPGQEIIPSQTNDTFLSLYTFCEPKTFSDRTCLICQEKFSSDEQVKKHFRSKEHIQNFSLQNKLPHQTAEWWDLFEGENEIQHFLRMDIATTIGPLPSYIKCIFAKGILFGNLWEVIPRDF